MLKFIKSIKSRIVKRCQAIKHWVKMKLGKIPTFWAFIGINTVAQVIISVAESRAVRGSGFVVEIAVRLAAQAARPVATYASQRLAEKNAENIAYVERNERSGNIIYEWQH